VAKVDAENSVPKQRGRPFQPGRSGNPAGKPKGARNRSTLAAELLLEGEAKALTRKAIELGLAGDTSALRLCLERLMPPRKDRPILLDLPNIASAADALKANGVVLAAVAEGRITPNEAGEVMRLIESCQKNVSPEAQTGPVVHIAFVGSQSDGATEE
jgi:hypothetical protein